jgi:glycosyltransferase involved in cell wall biosynthesis
LGSRTIAVGEYLKIFTIVSDIPYSDYNVSGVTAVHIVIYELLSKLAEKGHSIVSQPIFNTNRTSTNLTDAEESQVNSLKSKGFLVLEPFYSTHYAAKTGIFEFLKSKFIMNRIEDFYPTVRIKEQVLKRVHEQHSGVILTLWSQEGVAATHNSDVPRIVYHGDVDFVIQSARLRDSKLFLGEGKLKNFFKNIYRWYRLAHLKKIELEVFNKTEIMAHITQWNADYFSKNGHKRSLYVGNLWSDRLNRGYQGNGNALLPSTKNTQYKIIGHFGRLSATGGTYGLNYLLNEVVPALENELSDLDYSVHIIGAGQINPRLKDKLNQKRVVVRGFVEDLDSEIKSADAVLMLNNSGRYVAAFTRHIVVWSLRGCLICHANSKLAIPEIENEKNALFAQTPEKIAKMVRRVIENKELNQKLREEGRKMYESFFSPEHIADRINKEIIRFQRAFV